MYRGWRGQHQGLLAQCLVAAQIEGLMRGLGRDKFPELLVKAAGEAEERCLPILEEIQPRVRPREL